MKGIESVMRGYAEGGSVNPFQAYAGSPTYNPFDYLGVAAEYAPRPPVQIRTPGSTPGTANPLAPAAGGYQNIYGNLEAIKAIQALKRAAAPASTTVPEAPSTPTGEGGGSTGFSSTPPGTPGSGFNVPGNVLGVAGLLAGIPGAGALGSALGTQAANDYLASLGLPQNVSTLEALKSGLSFGLFGQTPQSQVDKSVEEAVKRGDLTITDLHNILDSLKGPTVAEQYGAQVASGQRSPTGAFFDAINDLNTVGRLSEVFDAIDKPAREQAERTQGLEKAIETLAAGEAALGGVDNTFGGPGGRATDAAPTFGGVSDVDIEAATAAAAASVAEASSEGEGEGEGEGGGEGEGEGGGGEGDGGSGEGDGGGGGEYARGGYVPGGSGGMDDDVPAIIDGKGPARLSSGEFVFDAATVAALGDGNNQAGARKLDGLRKAIRKKAYGHEKQPPKNYSVGDLVRMHDRRR